MVFADLSDEELDVVFDQVINETVADVQEPFDGWMRIWKDLTESVSEFSESNARDEVGEGFASESTKSSVIFSFFSSLFLLLTSPVALLRNVLVLVMEAPFSNTAWLLLVFIAIPAVLLQTDWQGPAATSSTSSVSTGIVNLASVLLMILSPDLCVRFFYYVVEFCDSLSKDCITSLKD